MNLADVPAHVLSVLNHAAGAKACTRDPRIEVGWRSHYCCGEGHHGWDACREAVTLGLMVAEPDAEGLGTTDTAYRVTAAGREVVSTWVKDQLRNRVWRTTVRDGDEEFVHLYVADSRAKARAKQIADLRVVWQLSWRAAAKLVVSVRQVRASVVQR